MSLWFEGELFSHIKFTILLMQNGSDKITRNPLQELNPTKAIGDHEIKTWLALGIKSKKKWVERKRKVVSLQDNIFTHVMLQLVCWCLKLQHQKNTYYFLCYRKKGCSRQMTLEMGLLVCIHPKVDRRKLTRVQSELHDSISKKICMGKSNPFVE